MHFFLQKDFDTFTSTLTLFVIIFFRKILIPFATLFLKYSFAYSYPVGIFIYKEKHYVKKIQSISINFEKLTLKPHKIL